MKNVLLSFSFILIMFNLSAQWVSGGTQLSTSFDHHHRAFVSSAGAGAYYVTWEATDTTSAGLTKIKLGAYDAMGNIRTGWSVGGMTISPVGDHYAPQIITSEDGGVIVSWYGYAGASTVSQIYVQKYSSSGSALWNSGNPVQVSTGTIYNHKYPILTSDKSNGVYITWTRYDNANSASSPDVFLQRIDQTGSVAAGWSTSSTSVAITAGVRECESRLALTPDLSSVYVVYASGLIGNTSLVLKKYNSTDGAMASGWAAAGVNISAGPNVYPEISHDLSLFSDASNNADVFWLESRSSANGEIYMQEVTPSGIKILAPTGNLLAGATANGVDYLEISQEADYDFLLAFNNLETFNDVETMKVKPDGTVLWHDVANTTGGNSAYPMAVSNGKKGMYVFYVKTSSPEKLYALALDSLGVLYSSFALPGSGFGNINNYDGFDPNYDLNPVATNTGEAVVAWNRKTSNNLYSIFSCNLLDNGATCTTNTAGVNEETNPKDIMLVYPNPFNNAVTFSPQFLSSATEKNIIIKVIDISGRLISESAGNKTSQIILHNDNWAKGMYFYQILDSNGVLQSGKIVKD